MAKMISMRGARQRVKNADRRQEGGSCVPCRCTAVHRYATETFDWYLPPIVWNCLTLHLGFSCFPSARSQRPPTKFHLCVVTSTILLVTSKPSIMNPCFLIILGSNGRDLLAVPRHCDNAKLQEMFNLSLLKYSTAQSYFAVALESMLQELSSIIRSSFSTTQRCAGKPLKVLEKNYIILSTVELPSLDQKPNVYDFPTVMPCL